MPLCLCAFFFLSQPASASPPPPSLRPAADADQPQLFLEFGWAGRIDPDRWTPVRITVQGGAEPFSGAVVIEHAQDPTQTAAVTIPVTATPGRTSHTTAALSLPHACDRITARLVDARGRTVRQLVYSYNPSPQQHPLPEFAVGFEPVTAAVGPGRSAASPLAADGAAASISLLDDTFNPQTRGQRILSPTSRRPIHPADLPMAWAAYDGASLLAIDADAAAAADPRSIAAVREWVAGGGRLLVVAASPGDAWRHWLPPSTLGDLITLDEPTRAPIPPDLADVVLQAHARAAQEDAEFDAAQQAASNSGDGPVGAYGPFRPSRRAPGGDTPQDETDADGPDAPAADTSTATPVRPADSATQRAIRLTPRGRDGGWRLRWRPDAPPSGVAWVVAPDAPPSADATGLLAEGPVGLGWVTVIGVDPRRIATPAGDTATRGVWKDAVAVALAHRQRLADAASASRWGSWYSWSEANEARVSILNELANAPGAGRASFLVIVAAMIGLALLMGPIDAAVLKRLRARHRSWLTAILWIALATLAAYMAPELSRSSTDAVARLSAVDVLVPPGDTRGAAAPEHALAWQTSITGVFTGRSMHAALTPVPGPDGAVAAHWWRGFSAVDYYGSPDHRLGAPVPTMQTLPDLGSVDAAADPWGGWGDRRRVGAPADAGADARAPAPIPGAAAMMAAPLRTWTFRSFEDQARTAPPCTALVRHDDGDLVVEVAGLPEGARIAAAACRIGADWHDLHFGPFGPAPGEPSTARLGPPRAQPPVSWTGVSLHPSDPWARGRQRLSVRSTPSVALLLPGPDRRALAAETLLASRRWAAVYLHLEDMPSDVALTAYPRRDEPLRPTRTVVCRILTPLPTAPPAPAAAPSPGDPR